MNPNTIPANPSVAKITPGQSNRASIPLRLSGIFHAEMPITAAAMGTLMKKTQRQEAYSVSHPPNAGPTAVVIDVNPDHVPMARPRPVSSKDELIIARLPGTRRTAPMPCTLRAMIRSCVVGATRQAMDATAKRACPRGISCGVHTNRPASLQPESRLPGTVHTTQPPIARPPPFDSFGNLREASSGLDTSAITPSILGCCLAASTRASARLPVINTEAPRFAN